MEKLKMLTPDLVKNNIEKIKKIFPDCITEHIRGGRTGVAVDFDKLRQQLSGSVIEGDEERYQFTWPGKKQSIITANAPISKTLRPCREESVDFDNTENLYIEGDNLDVLKLLREDYLGKVKMIYIDPPYNTGNDFVYEDKFAKSTDDYIENSCQVDDDGNHLVANPESNGRFHTDWLNMIYPRIKIAKDLLSSDGVIFISIDDNEAENLKKICNEIFGEQSFVAVFPRLTTKSGKTPLTYMISHDYVLCYAKSRTDIFIGKDFVDDSYKYSDEFVETRGKYNLKQPLDCNSISYSGSLDYPIEHNGVTYYPGSDYNAYIERKKGNHLQKDYAWRWSKDLYEFGLNNGWIVFQNGRIYTKGYLKAAIEKGPDGKYCIIDRPKTRKMSTIDFISNDFSNDIAKKQLAAYKINAKFDYPKPVDLIKELIQSYYDKDALFMDFFSGSGTSAEAVLRANSEDGGKRKFIMIQLPESLDNQDYPTICQLAEERIRLVGKRILEEQKTSQVDGTDDAKVRKLDVGFRVLKLDSSNMKDVYYKPSDVTNDLFAQTEDNIKEDRTDEDLLFQVMLELAVPLSAKIRSEEICGRKTMVVDDNYLIACFDKDITDEVVTDIAKRKPQYFVMRDSSAMDDSVITNFETIFQTYSKDTVRKIL